jgi:hypothetical protein
LSEKLSPKYSVNFTNIFYEQLFCKKVKLVAFLCFSLGLTFLGTQGAKAAQKKVGEIDHT